ncbi:hypothetical protein BC828DRAFT_380759 [Blastocladiella britannica]|nr:hypothetical protein BC828DRAFT_380759 [Blastocladiella britannica]
MASSTKPAPGKQCPELKGVATTLKVSLDTNATDCCQWAGIKCNNDGYVTTMNWLLLGANGTIPDSIQKLTSLEYISLAANQLTGSIPSALGQLTNLTTLSLRNNQLGGEIPESMGALLGLTSLRLSDNKLSGHIPATMSKLSQLTELWLFNNQLDGPVPDLTATQNCTLLPQQSTTSICYAGDARIGKCYGDITGNGIKSCLTSVIPIVAGGAAAIVVAMVVGALMYRLRRAKAAAAAANTLLASKTPDQSLLSPSNSTDMDSATVIGDRVADDPWRQTGILPGHKTALAPASLAMLDTLDRMELPMIKKADVMPVDRVAIGAGSAAGPHPMAFAAPHGGTEMDSEDLVLPSSGPLAGSQAYPQGPR